MHHNARLAPRANIIVTGIPRSGTTLVAALLDNADNTICLREPDNHVQWLVEAPTASDYVDAIVSDYHRTRDRVSAGMPVVDRRSGGVQSATNYFLPRHDATERRAPNFEAVEIDTRHLRENFSLAVKHNVEYTSVLPELAASGQFTILCPLRNPIATILSWNTLTTPVAQGDIPMARYFWPEVRRRTESIADLIERQVAIFDVFCERYWAFKDHIHVIHYERLIENQEIVAAAIGRNALHRLQLGNSNHSPQYDWSLAAKIYSAISTTARAIGYFYTDAQLRALVPGG